MEAATAVDELLCLPGWQVSERDLHQRQGYLPNWLEFLQRHCQLRAGADRSPLPLPHQHRGPDPVRGLLRHQRGEYLR